MNSFTNNTRVVIIGGGPGGCEAAASAAQLGAETTLIENVGIGGSAVLTDVVPSKSLIAVANAALTVAGAHEFGIHTVDSDSRNPVEISIDVGMVNARLRALAQQQSDDMRDELRDAGVKLITGYGRLADANTVVVSDEPGGAEKQRCVADTIVVAVGASPRELNSARPDGERILSWKQLYTMTTLPEHLIVVGSGVTGTEFASAYMNLGSTVTLVSSREQVLPGEDQDAAAVLEKAFTRGGMTLVSRARADRVDRTDNGVRVALADGRTLEGSHCLMAVGSIPNTADLGLRRAGVEVTESGHIRVNRVSRTSVPNIYAVGDCTTLPPLASVAAAQGRTAVFHALGDIVIPLDQHRIAANTFTAPEIATVGWQESDIRAGKINGVVHKLPLASNARAKMMRVEDGFVKIIAREGSGTVIGGVIVGPHASELIYPVAIAAERRLTVDQVSRVFTAFPSLTGSIQDAMRDMHTMGQADRNG